MTACGLGTAIHIFRPRLSPHLQEGRELAEVVALALTFVFGRAFSVEQINVNQVSQRRERDRQVIEARDIDLMYDQAKAASWPMNWKESVARYMQLLTANKEKP